MKLTTEQKKALKRVYDRDQNNGKTYLQFRRQVFAGFDCIMLPWSGMWLGIEKDGYTHS
jgi:hypothetical protein